MQAREPGQSFNGVKPSSRDVEGDRLSRVSTTQNVRRDVPKEGRKGGGKAG